MSKENKDKSVIGNLSENAGGWYDPDLDWYDADEDGENMICDEIPTLSVKNCLDCPWVKVEIIPTPGATGSKFVFRCSRNIKPHRIK